MTVAQVDAMEDLINRLDFEWQVGVQLAYVLVQQGDISRYRDTLEEVKRIRLQLQGLKQLMGPGKQERLH